MSARKKKPGKPGRPKLPKGTANTEVFAMKVSRADLAAMEKAAKRAGKPLRTWAREALLELSRDPE